MKQPSIQELKVHNKYIRGGMFFLVIWGLILVYRIVNGSRQGGDTWIEYLFILLLFVGAGVYLLNLYKYRVFISDQFIEVKSLFKHKKVLVGRIGSYETERGAIDIYLKNYTEMPVLSIALILDDMDLLYEWLAEHSRSYKLEARIMDLEDISTEFLENDAYGRNQIEKKENLEITQKIARWLIMTSFLILIVVVGGLYLLPIYWVDTVLILAIFIPLLCIYFANRYKGFFNLGVNEKKIDVFPSIFMVILLPSVLLVMYWLIMNLYIYDTTKIWCWAAGTSLLLTPILVYPLRDIEFKKWKSYVDLATVMACMVGYGYGAVAHLNVYWDQSEAQQFVVKVLKKEKHRGEDGIKQLRLEKWGKYEEAHPIDVEQYLFDEVEEGDKVSIDMYQGYFGIAYYALYLEE